MATTRVQLPNGDFGEFPASMTQEQIEGVLAKQFPPESPRLPVSPLRPSRRWRKCSTLVLR